MESTAYTVAVPLAIMISTLHVIAVEFTTAVITEFASVLATCTFDELTNILPTTSNDVLPEPSVSNVVPLALALIVSAMERGFAFSVTVETALPLFTNLTQDDE